MAISLKRAKTPLSAGPLGHLDSLTGLPDRLLLADRLQVALSQAERDRHLVALVVIDLARTTEMRATLGLQAGEELTRTVGRHLSLFARRSDTLAYIGSDLFAIVMPRVRSLPQILGLTSRIMTLFDDAWEVADDSLHLRPGVGVAYYPENGTGADELITQAVMAAGRSASEGRLQPTLADPVWHAEARERLALEADLRRALEHRELTLFYQPQVSATSGCVTGFEALVRWPHPQRGLVMPNTFIPLAEDTHLIVPIGAWVIGEAARQLAAWRTAGYPQTRVAVNLAAEQLSDAHLIDLLDKAILRNRLVRDQLEVEITERTAIADKKATAQAIGRLKQLGVRVTLDDFGTGYSSALLLVEYPFDTLKVDRSFVAKLHEPKERAVTEAIIVLAHRLGYTVVAEGVETIEQLRLLREMGADEIQGFLFARPVPAQECEAFLRGSCSLPG